MEGVSKDACQANLDMYMDSSSTLLLIHPITSSQAYLPKTALSHLVISFKNLKFGEYQKRKMATTLVAAGEPGRHHPGGLRTLPPTGKTGKFPQGPLSWPCNLLRAWFYEPTPDQPLGCTSPIKWLTSWPLFVTMFSDPYSWLFSAATQAQQLTPRQ